MRRKAEGEGQDGAPARGAYRAARRLFERLSTRRTRRREDDGQHGVENSRESIAASRWSIVVNRAHTACAFPIGLSG
jgi:hypothetical protein